MICCGFVAQPQVQLMLGFLKQQAGQAAYCAFTC
jgi:hypothetical protein